MAKKKNESAEGEFVNPFKPGVSYQDLIDALPEGVTVKEYLKGKQKEDGSEFTEDEINWVSNECDSHLFHLEHKEENLKQANETYKKLLAANDPKTK
jgi:hypothetical protein